MDTAGVASSDQTVKMLVAMTLDSQNKGSNGSDDVKKPSGRKFGPLHKGNVTNGQDQKYKRSTIVQPDYMDQSMYYANSYPYFYGAYDSTGQDWDDYQSYFHAEEAEGVYGDNGPLIYNPYVYPPYVPYSPVISYVDAQQYQHIASHPSMNTSSAPFTPGSTVVEQRDVKVAKEQIQTAVTVIPVDGNDLNVKSGILPAKALYSNPTFHAKFTHRLEQIRM